MEQPLLYLAALSLFFCALTYRLLWQRRYGRPPSRHSSVARLAGEICGPGCRGTEVATTGSFELLSSGTVHTVFLDPTSEITTWWTLRVGQRVTVDGVKRLVPAVQTEMLYRQHPWVPGLDAARVTAGSWPRLRWLLPAASLAALALFVFAACRPYWAHPRRLVVERSAAMTSCPKETVRETLVGPDGVLHRCRGRRDGLLEGTYTLWTWAGRLVERGEHDHGGYRVVRETMLHPDTTRRTTFVGGRRHGPTVVLHAPAGRSQRRRYHVEYNLGRKDGLERGWYANGTLAFERWFSNGKPDGIWRYYDRQGHTVALGHAQKDPWTFNDARGQRCLGFQLVADDWLRGRFDIEHPESETERHCQLRCPRAQEWRLATRCTRDHRF